MREAERGGRGGGGGGDRKTEMEVERKVWSWKKFVRQTMAPSPASHHQQLGVSAPGSHTETHSRWSEVQQWAARSEFFSQPTSLREFEKNAQITSKSKQDCGGVSDLRSFFYRCTQGGGAQSDKKETALALYVQFRGYFFHPDTMEANGTLLVVLTALKNDILLFNCNVFLPTHWPQWPALVKSSSGHFRITAPRTAQVLYESLCMLDSITAGRGIYTDFWQRAEENQSQIKHRLCFVSIVRKTLRQRLCHVSHLGFKSFHFHSWWHWHSHWETRLLPITVISGPGVWANTANRVWTKQQVLKDI